MKIIIDECVPSIVKRRLPSRKIVTVQAMGWAGIKNGQLLRLIAADFDIFITSDKNLRHQQNLASFDISVILPKQSSPRRRSHSQSTRCIDLIGENEFIAI